jgi:hypothetical protein
MPAWHLNRALTAFRAAVNAAYPNRDRGSDGTIGDEAHQAGSSDHNPDADGSVDAWDMDVNLRSGNDAAAIEALKRVFQAHLSSKYWIHNDQIARREYGWRRDSYSYAGPSRNRHTQHVHWNTRESHEDSTAPWNVEDDMTPEQLKTLNDTAWQTRNVPAPDGTRKILTGAVGQLVERVLVLEKVVAGLATASPLTETQMAELMAAAEREAREEVREALRDAADAAGPDA